MPFGLVIPGRHAILSSVPSPFLQRTSDAEWCIRVDAPADVSTVSIFLTSSLLSLGRSDVGLCLYWFLPNAPSDRQFMGVLTDNVPSAILPTGFSFMDSLKGAQYICLCARLELASEIVAKADLAPGLTSMRDFARKTALNLYRYIESFKPNVPANVLELWFERFEHRFARDPNFVLKTE